MKKLAVLTYFICGTTQAVAGVLSVLTAADIPGLNNFNPVSMSTPEELLAQQRVLYAGQPVAIVIAGT